jgi:UDP-N-acetylglucosamine 2-epimerase (non-hydrolysing)
LILRVLTILGTRPEIIRLSLIVKRLDRYCDHVLLYTGQNFAKTLRDVFFDELDYRDPDLDLGISETGFAEQAARIISECDAAMERFNPDRILVLGDTNSGLAALPAARRRIPVFHLEAGNRCFDDRVPEEINRRVIDHCSTVLMPYTHRSKENLVREGIPRERIFVVGNPIAEVMAAFQAQVRGSNVLSELGLEEGAYMLASMHRSENVDNERRIASLMAGLSEAAVKHDRPVVLSLHPRTADRMSAFDIGVSGVPGVRFVEPVGFFDWVRLEQGAFCVITDSGTVQEECCILKVPNITIRDVTERPETVEAGSNMLVGVAPPDIVRAIGLVVEQGGEWIVPAEYQASSVSAAVTKIVLGYHDLRP